MSSEVAALVDGLLPVLAGLEVDRGCGTSATASCRPFGMHIKQSRQLYHMWKPLELEHSGAVPYIEVLELMNEVMSGATAAR